MAKKVLAGRGKRSMMSAELGRWGEKRFASLCGDVCSISTKPEYDINGWDFLVEFPQPGIEADTDVVARQEPLKCFVQVKTVWSGRPEINLGLSAAARLGKSPLPSFLCILEAFGTSDAPELCRMHVIHITGPLLESVLRNLREMQAAGQSRSINKADFRVRVPRVSESLPPVGKALLDAIERATGPDHAAYRRQKDEFLRNVGYSTSRVAGTVSIRSESQADYHDFLLGLKSLPIVDYGISEMRWDIGIPFQFTGKPVELRMIPKGKEVEIVWRRAGVFSPIRMKMTAFLASGLGDDVEAARWLFTSPNLELKVEAANISLTLRGADVVATSYRTLAQLHAIEEFLASDDRLDIQLLWRGRLMSAWSVDEPTPLRRPEATAALGEIIKQLEIVSKTAGLQDIQLPMGSWAEWLQQLGLFHAMLQEPYVVTASLNLQGKAGLALDSTERETLHVTALELGHHLLACYATCQGRLVATDHHGRWQLQARDFVLRDLRRVEKSDEAMHAFAKEAEAITGLTTTILAWSASPGPISPPQPDQPLRARWQSS